MRIKGLALGLGPWGLGLQRTFLRIFAFSWLDVLKKKRTICTVRLGGSRVSSDVPLKPTSVPAGPSGCAQSVMQPVNK